MRYKLVASMLTCTTYRFIANLIMKRWDSNRVIVQRVSIITRRRWAFRCTQPWVMLSRPKSLGCCMRRFCEIQSFRLLRKSRSIERVEVKKNFSRAKSAWCCINWSVMPQGWKARRPLFYCHSNAVCMAHRLRHHILGCDTCGLDG